MATIATSKNLTILGALTIAGALVAAGVALFDGDPNTNVDLEATFVAISAGIGMILGKGAASTGGTVPETPEAVRRVALATAASSVDLGQPDQRQPKGFARYGTLRLLAVASVLLLPGCAALSRASGSTGPIDLGGGYLCSASAGATDQAACTKAISQTCEAPLPKDEHGTCTMPPVVLSLPFTPRPGWQCTSSAAPGITPCTQALTTACTVPVPRDAAGACP